MAAKHPCWFCEKICTSKRELKNHVARDDHSALRVLCVWCDDGKSFRRSLDLKVHVESCHPEEKVDPSLLKESQCYWFALNPKDYAKVIEIPDSSTPLSETARCLVLSWLDDGNVDPILKKSKEDWIKDWGLDVPVTEEDIEAISLTAPSEDGFLDEDTRIVEPYDPLMPSMTSSESNSSYTLAYINVDGNNITLEWKISAGSWKWLQTNFHPSFLLEPSVGPVLSKKLLELCAQGQQHPTGDGIPVPSQMLSQLTRELTSSVGFPISISSLKSAFYWPAVTPPAPISFQTSVPTTIPTAIPPPPAAPLFCPRTSDPCLEPSAKRPRREEELPLSKEARNMLMRGLMPLVPPARREWTRRESPLKIGSTAVVWPPRGWNSMSPDRRLLQWEFTSMIFEMQLNQAIPQISRDDLLAKYNFLALPGTAEPRIEDSEVSKMRFYNHKFLLKLALITNVRDMLPNAPHMMEMFRRSFMVRDTSLDSLLDQLSDVPLRLQA